MSASEQDSSHKHRPIDQIYGVEEGFGELSVFRGFDSRGGVILGVQVSDTMEIEGSTEDRAQAYAKERILQALAERLALEVGCELVPIEEAANGQ